LEKMKEKFREQKQLKIKWLSQAIIDAQGNKIKAQINKETQQ